MRLTLTLIAFGTIILDQFSKLYMIAHPALYRTGSFFELFVTTNEGIAFSIPLKGTVLYILIAIITILGVYYSRTHFNWSYRLTAIVFGLIIGGGIGNLIDRIRLGHVIDFIKLGFWPMFNIADIALTLAIMLLIWKSSQIIIKPQDPK